MLLQSILLFYTTNKCYNYTKCTRENQTSKLKQHAVWCYTYKSRDSYNWENGLAKTSTNHNIDQLVYKQIVACNLFPLSPNINKATHNKLQSVHKQNQP